MLDLPFLFKVSRPRFWLYLFGPFLIGLIAGANERSDFHSPYLLLFGIYFLFPANLLLYGVNDVFDYETDKLNAKKIEYELAVEPGLHRILLAAIVLLNLPFIVTSFFLNTTASLSLTGFLFFAIFYSAPPIRAKSKPYLDSGFNVLYVFPGVFSYALVTGILPSLTPVAAAALWTMAMHAYSAVPDIDADRNAGIATIATRLGPTRTLWLCLGLYSLSTLLAFFSIGLFALILGCVFFVMIAISLKSKKPDQLFKVYRAFPVVNALAGFLLFWHIALSKLEILK